jgi:3-hydroxyisobutyrate dehydrogenase-like beta-hydroxyacid dehydrogenase
MARRDVVFYLSGDEQSARLVEPLLRACGRDVFFLGAFGNGTRLKLVANHLVTIHNAAAAEALVLARRAGIDPAVALRALLAGAAESRMLEVRGPAMVAQCYVPPAMRIDTFMKDIAIIRAFAQDAGCVLSVFEAAAALHEEARDAGWADADPASVHAVVEQHSASR